MTIVEAARGVTGGVDTHLDVHVAAALDPLGGLLGTERFETNAAGYKALLGWLGTFGDVTKVGVEGTGSYGSGLARYLKPGGGRGPRGRPTGPSEAPSQRQVRSPRRHRGRPGRLEWSGQGQAQVAATVPSRPSGSSSSPSAQPARPGARLWFRCATSATALLNSCVVA